MRKTTIVIAIKKGGNGSTISLRSDSGVKVVFSTPKKCSDVGLKDFAELVFGALKQHINEDTAHTVLKRACGIKEEEPK